MDMYRLFLNALSTVDFFAYTHIRTERRTHAIRNMVILRLHATGFFALANLPRIFKKSFSDYSPSIYVVCACATLSNIL